MLAADGVRALSTRRPSGCGGIWLFTSTTTERGLRGVVEMTL